MDFKDISVTFNQCLNELDELYHNYAKEHDLSDTALWLLYALHENDAAYTQRQLCNTWYCAPQTMNSALKNLEKKGYIQLRSTPENQKNKIVELTDDGTKIAQAVISPLMFAEHQTLQELTEKERAVLVSLSQKYIAILRSKLEKAQ